jgi:hypothetical protein
MKFPTLLLLGQNSVDQFADPQRVTPDVEPVGRFVALHLVHSLSRGDRLVARCARLAAAEAEAYVPSGGQGEPTSTSCLSTGERFARLTRAKPKTGLSRSGPSHMTSPPPARPSTVGVAGISELRLSPRHSTC